LHRVFPRLPDEKSVLFEILANVAFVDGGHLWIADFGLRIGDSNW
jgi:hypothetical protein